MIEKHLVISDLHFPFVDGVALKCVLGWIKRERPHAIHCLGDVADFYALSRFNKDPARLLGLQQEIDSASDLLHEMRALVPRAKIIYSEGNHEARLLSYLQSKAPELSSLRGLTPQALFRLNECGVSWKNAHEPYWVSKLLLTHGHIVRKWSGATARAHFEKFGSSVLHGHSHRLGQFFHSFAGQPYVAVENGCLCSLDPEYDLAPDWQQGFSVVYLDGSSFQITTIPIFAKKYFFEGRVYKA